MEDVCGKTSLSEKLPVTKTLPRQFSTVLYAYSGRVPSSFQFLLVLTRRELLFDEMGGRV